MAFRPCIDLRNGLVVQIVGGTLSDDDSQVRTNFVSERSATDFTRLYAADGLLGGHVIMLGPGNEQAAREALAAYPKGLQVGGGINPDNALSYVEGGASHVIVTSYLFDGSRLSLDRVKRMADAVGAGRLVIDVSCRRTPAGDYRVATNRWQTVTDTVVDGDLFESLQDYCAEFLVHAADVEGQCRGIDQELVVQLGGAVTRPTTYAGGAKALDDIALVQDLSGGKVDLTIGSALDIFGGSGVRYVDAARLGVRE